MSASAQRRERFSEVRNSKAQRDYFVEDKFEAGIVLKGSEVKAIREGRAQLTDGFARVDKGELWLYNIHIDEYSFAAYNNHDPRRPRKLLLNRREIRKIAAEMEQGGKALIPLALYFKDALVKVRMALATGKKHFDKRETIKERDQMREIRRELHRRR